MTEAEAVVVKPTAICGKSPNSTRIQISCRDNLEKSVR